MNVWSWSEVDHGVVGEDSDLATIFELLNGDIDENRCRRNDVLSEVCLVELSDSTIEISYLVETISERVVSDHVVSLLKIRSALGRRREISDHGAIVKDLLSCSICLIDDVVVDEKRRRSSLPRETSVEVLETNGAISVEVFGDVLGWVSHLLVVAGHIEQ
jgi:hypothetical protein